MSERVPDLLASSPETAYLWGRVAGDGEVTRDTIAVRTADEHAARRLAEIVGTDGASVDHEVAEREHAHDASVTHVADEFTVEIEGAPAARASEAFDVPKADESEFDPSEGYRFDAFTDHRRQLVRGLLEACGTVCFRESAGEVGVSFVHDDAALLGEIRDHLDAAPPTVPTDDLSETSSGGHWFGLADGADVPAFAEWVYEGSDASGLYAPDRRRKLRRSVERAASLDVGHLEG